MTIASKRWLSLLATKMCKITMICRLRDVARKEFHFVRRNCRFQANRATMSYYLPQKNRVATTSLTRDITSADANSTKQLKIYVFVDFQEIMVSLNFRVTFSEIIVAFLYKFVAFSSKLSLAVAKSTIRIWRTFLYDDWRKTAAVLFARRLLQARYLGEKEAQGNWAEG